MLLEVLDRSLDTWTYNEDSPAAFTANMRLKDSAYHQKLLKRARCRWVVLKPILDNTQVTGPCDVGEL